MLSARYKLLVARQYCSVPICRRSYFISATSLDCVEVIIRITRIVQLGNHYACTLRSSTGNFVLGHTITLTVRYARFSQVGKYVYINIMLQILLKYDCLICIEHTSWEAKSCSHLVTEFIIACSVWRKSVFCLGVDYKTHENRLYRTDQNALLCDIRKITYNVARNFKVQANCKRAGYQPCLVSGCSSSRRQIDKKVHTDYKLKR